MSKKNKKEPAAAHQEAESREASPEAMQPLVFISHDTRDAAIAEAFSNLLTDASGGILKSFRSSDNKGTTGIAFGADWREAIMEQLDAATDVVALLTQHSHDRPWILYETGVAHGKLDRTVLGLALGLPLTKAATGPFAQFQNCSDDEDSLTKLVLQLIRRHPMASPRDEAVRRQVRAFLESLDSIRKASPPPQASASADTTSIAKLFEEIKILVRDVPSILATLQRLSEPLVAGNSVAPPANTTVPPAPSESDPPRRGYRRGLFAPPVSTRLILDGDAVNIKFAKTWREEFRRLGGQDSPAGKELMTEVTSWVQEDSSRLDKKKGRTANATFSVARLAATVVEFRDFSRLPKP